MRALAVEMLMLVLSIGLNLFARWLLRPGSTAPEGSHSLSLSGQATSLRLSGIPPRRIPCRRQEEWGLPPVSE